MRNYLKQLCFSQLLLWCYLIWYLVIIARYFDSNVSLWLNALGISIIVGFALLLSTSYWPLKIKSLDRWRTARLFIIPFCVASYSSLTLNKGFLLIFPPDIKSNSIAVAAILSFLLLAGAIKKIH